jgi:hypothetical protein
MTINTAFFTLFFTHYKLSKYYGYINLMYITTIFFMALIMLHIASKRIFVVMTANVEKGEGVNES